MAHVPPPAIFISGPCRGDPRGDLPNNTRKTAEHWLIGKGGGVYVPKVPTYRPHDFHFWALPAIRGIFLAEAYAAIVPNHVARPDNARNPAEIRRALVNWKRWGVYVPKATTVSRMAHVPPPRFPFLGPAVAIPGIFATEACAAIVPHHVARPDNARKPAEHWLFGKGGGSTSRKRRLSRGWPTYPPAVAMPGIFPTGPTIPKTRRALVNWKRWGVYVPEATTVSRMAHVPPRRFPFLCPAGAIPGIFPAEAYTAIVPNHVARPDNTKKPAEHNVITGLCLGCAIYNPPTQSTTLV